MIKFQSECIHSITDDNGAFCNLNPNQPIECTYINRWNECYVYKSVRQAMREL